jgi:hypothetical protein
MHSVVVLGRDVVHNIESYTQNCLSGSQPTTSNASRTAKTDPGFVSATSYASCSMLQSTVIFSRCLDIYQPRYGFSSKSAFLVAETPVHPHRGSTYEHGLRHITHPAVQSYRPSYCAAVARANRSNTSKAAQNVLTPNILSFQDPTSHFKYIRTLI